MSRPPRPSSWPAALALAILRRATNRFAILRRVWHPALFEFAVYVILASGLTLFLAHRSG